MLLHGMVKPLIRQLITVLILFYWVQKFLNIETQSEEMTNIMLDAFPRTDGNHLAQNFSRKI
jgi:hypothetical protein